MIGKAHILPLINNHPKNHARTIHIKKDLVDLLLVSVTLEALTLRTDICLARQHLRTLQLATQFMLILGLLDLNIVAPIWNLMPGSFLLQIKYRILVHMKGEGLPSADSLGCRISIMSFANTGSLVLVK